MATLGNGLPSGIPYRTTNVGRSVSSTEKRTAPGSRLASENARLRDALASHGIDPDAPAGHGRPRPSPADHLPEAVLMVGPAGDVTYANAAACRLLGRAREDILGRPFDGTVRPAASARADGAAREVEETVLRGDGRAIPVVSSYSTVEGGATGMVVTMRAADARERQGLLVQELAHRVKNILALVQAIASQTLRSARSLDDARETFASRLRALATAHDALTGEGVPAASVGALVLGALRLHDDGRQGRFAVSGPDVALGEEAALSVAMVLHELGTNATKYGSLSAPGGSVSVSWDVSGAPGDGRLALEWRETGGPPARPPTRTGFGTRLIDRSLVRPFGATVVRDYDETGFSLRVEAAISGLAPRGRD